VSYRPITDVWILARSKVPYYGAYPAGFLHRARALLGVGTADPVLHVCGGRVRDYPYSGFGPNDRTLDLDPALKPDYLRDAQEPFPLLCLDADHEQGCVRGVGNPTGSTLLLHKYWSAVLIDRPYSRDDATKYAPGPDTLPDANLLIRNAFDVLPIGGRVGMLDYVWPHPGNRGKEVAVVAVGTVRNNRARWFTVFEKLA
jgi:hypothetical protein